jgi:hypothetical protein
MYRGFHGSARMGNLYRALFDVRANMHSLASRAGRRAAVAAAAASSGRAQLAAISRGGSIIGPCIVTAIPIVGAGPTGGSRNKDIEAEATTETTLVAVRAPGSISSSLVTATAEEDGEPARRCRVRPCPL